MEKQSNELQKAFKFIENKYLLLYLLVFDVFIIILHFLVGRRYQLFNIDVESNVPTMYQGIKLLTFGYIFSFILYTLKVKSKKTIAFWATSSLMFIFLGLDEIGQIHENVPRYFAEFFPITESQGVSFLDRLNYDGAVWVLYYIPIMLLVGLPIAIFHFTYLQKRIGKKIWLFIIGFLLLFSIPLIEISNSNGLMAPDAYNVSIAFEEFFEMAGISLVAFSYYVASKSEKLSLAK